MIGSVFSPPNIPQAIEVQLVRQPKSVRLARSLVREWFRHWNVPEQVIDGAELVASELVTNAVTKAKGMTIQMRIRWGETSGYVEVWDADPSPPIQRDAEETDTNGRGLFLVEMYAARWDHYPSEGGKVVWAELTLADVPA
jgi:anti-sigma regulatory factor (Ser/Thr protein kinase)